WGVRTAVGLAHRIALRIGRAARRHPMSSPQTSAATAAAETMLETRALTKEFQGFTAVQDVSLKVRRGSIHALIGPNGAGKTTCFNLLTHFLEPTRGQILY